MGNWTAQWWSTRIFNQRLQRSVVLRTTYVHDGYIVHRNSKELRQFILYGHKAFATRFEKCGADLKHLNQSYMVSAYMS